MNSADVSMVLMEFSIESSITWSIDKMLIISPFAGWPWRMSSGRCAPLLGADKQLSYPGLPFKSSNFGRICSKITVNGEEDRNNIIYDVLGIGLRLLSLLHDLYFYSLWKTWRIPNSCSSTSSICEKRLNKMFWRTIDVTLLRSSVKTNSTLCPLSRFTVLRRGSASSSNSRRWRA